MTTNKADRVSKTYVDEPSIHAPVWQGAPTHRKVESRGADHLSRTALRVRGILDAARRRLVTILYDARLPEAAQLLTTRNTNLLVVCDRSGRMAGVVTKTDIVRRIGRCHGHACGLSGAVVMTRDVFCCRSDDLLEDVWATMKLAGFREAPVVDQRGRAIGIVAARDILHALFERLGYEEDLLRDYVMGNGYH